MTAGHGSLGAQPCAEAASSLPWRPSSYPLHPFTLDIQPLLVSAYAATLGLLALYGLHRVGMLARFRWSREAPLPPAPSGALPRVTVQLPVYNERTVAVRLVRAALALDYPSELLEIQVLDDSNDDTCALVDEEVARGRAR